MFMHFNKYKNKRAQIAVEVAPSTPRHQYITYRSSEIIFNIHLSSVWFFLSCILEKLECQAKFPGYHSNGRIASVSPPSTTYKRQFSSQPKINTNKKKKKTEAGNVPRREENAGSHSPIENEGRRKTGYCNCETKRHSNEKREQ